MPYHMQLTVLFNSMMNSMLQAWKQSRAASKSVLKTEKQNQIASFASWRQQQLQQLSLPENQTT